MIIKKILNIFSDFYVFLFSNKYLDKVNNIILDSSLRVRGYRNSENFSKSGEKFFIKEILSNSNPKLCIDIGASTGTFSIELLKYTKAKIIAFEPLKSQFNKLKENLNLYSDRVILENQGVGCKNGYQELYFNEKVFDYASFSDKIDEISFIFNDKKKLTLVITLDSYCLNNNITEIDFLKIDSEGFESEIFNGAESVFKNIKPKFIQIEYGRHQLFRQKTLKYFHKKLPDYEVFQLVPGGWKKRDTDDPYSNIFHYSNFIFVRSY
jgi:FkbM family methyltransferase